MEWSSLAQRLFGPDHGLRADGDFLSGTVSFDGQPLVVVGTTGHAPIGVRLEGQPEAAQHEERGLVAGVGRAVAVVQARGAQPPLGSPHQLGEGQGSSARSTSR